jgi:hypothetical protein
MNFEHSSEQFSNVQKRALPDWEKVEKLSGTKSHYPSNNVNVLNPICI